MRTFCLVVLVFFVVISPPAIAQRGGPPGGGAHGGGGGGRGIHGGPGMRPSAAANHFGHNAVFPHLTRSGFGYGGFAWPVFYGPDTLGLRGDLPWSAAQSQYSQPQVMVLAPQIVQPEPAPPPPPPAQPTRHEYN